MHTPAETQQPCPQLMPWLRLMRLPTVFTSLTNILCGYLISSSERHLPAILADNRLWLLLLASATIYLSGMVLNDVFDEKLDAVERPNRPIPSGQVSRRAAAGLGAVLMLIGLIAAMAASSETNRTPIIIAASLSVTVLLYDGLLKNTVLAPLGMGSCRFLNIMLGASCCGEWGDVWSIPQMWVAAALGVYVFGVTLFARNEAGTSSRRQLWLSVLIVLAGLSINARFGWPLIEQSSAATGALIALSLIAANIGLRCTRAIRTNQPILLQKTVGFMLLNIIFIDAAMTFCVTGSGRLATPVVILVIPATLTKRVIPMS